MIIGYMQNMVGTSTFTAHLKVNDGVAVDDVEKVLRETIFSQILHSSGE